jgi:deoxyadenosine/deoxycytidine kinase
MNVWTRGFPQQEPKKPKYMGPRPLVISIEGNIGSGKTTVARELANIEYVTVCLEPVESWKHMFGRNLLKDYYENPKKNAFLLQSAIALSFLPIHNLQVDTPIKVLDRSFYSATPFIEVLGEQGNLGYSQIQALEDWRNELRWQMGNVHHILYLQTQPETVFKRIQERRREEENAINFDYLLSLHEAHERWLDKDKRADVTFIDACQDPAAVLNQVRGEIEKINNKYFLPV